MSTLPIWDDTRSLKWAWLWLHDAFLNLEPRVGKARLKFGVEINRCEDYCQPNK